MEAACPLSLGPIAGSLSAVEMIPPIRVAGTAHIHRPSQCMKDHESISKSL